MSFVRESANWPEIPNPMKQARVILEICNDDIHQARAITATNIKFARTEVDRRF